MTRAVVIVGAGRMGTALHGVLRRELPTGWALRRMGGRAFLRAPRRPRGVRQATWVLALRDGELSRGVEALATVTSVGDVVFHLAGMLGPEVLAPLRALGCAVGSMHPLVAVARGNTGAVCEGGAFVFEGDPRALREARAIVRALGGTLIIARSVDRARYHSAAALVATGAVALAQGAAELFAEALDPSPAEQSLRAAVTSLLRSVASNVEAVGVRHALASPLLREDTETLARHLAVLPPPARVLYRAAVSKVLDTLETEGLLGPVTVHRARHLVAQ